jgi:hypothetical protein
MRLALLHDVFDRVLGQTAKKIDQRKMKVLPQHFFPPEDHALQGERQLFWGPSGLHARRL